MPKLKRRADKYDPLRQLILGRMAVDDISFDTLGGYMGCSRQTASARVADPSTITLRELGALARGLQIPIAELREKIPN